MKKQSLILISTTLIITLILTGCNFPFPAVISSQDEISALENENSNNETAEGTSTPTSTMTPTAETTPEVTVTETESPQGNQNTEDSPTTLGPDNFPFGINPLTGLLADDPDLLKLPPALISISNFPASGRPQAGLNLSPIVFEIAIGEGMTRFLAMFYGQFPELISGQLEGQPAGSQINSDVGASIGPIRSGRLPYEGLRSFYSGFLVMASADSGVAGTLNQTTSIYGSDSDDINSAVINVDFLRELAKSHANTDAGSMLNLEGMKFSDISPNGGRLAKKFWLFYSQLNQVQWLYDQEIDAYIRYDIKTDGSGEFVMATDRLTGEPLSKENVIVIFAEHYYQAPTLIDINLINQPPRKALLFRDGEIHDIFWTSKFGEYEITTGLQRPMRFVDATGEPVSLKPGQTWIHIVSTYSYHMESAIRDFPFTPIVPEEGTGLWLVRYKGLY